MFGDCCGSCFLTMPFVDSFYRYITSLHGGREKSQKLRIYIYSYSELNPDLYLRKRVANLVLPTQKTTQIHGRINRTKQVTSMIFDGSEGFCALIWHRGATATTPGGIFTIQFFFHRNHGGL